MNIDNLKNKVIDSFLCVTFVAIVAGLSGLFVNSGMSWYMGLVKPKMYVPNSVFMIAWAIIYVVEIGSIVYLIVKNKLKKDIVSLAVVSGVLNILWCLVFFKFENTLIGLIVIILNLVMSIYLWHCISKESKWIKYMFSIYPLWLCLAMYLNMATWILN